ncbi:ATP-dependent DNA ligase [Candidatus Pacearchaeota archaeon]|nr:ATP-dependent DNA ligase [Candidatus Pacearchaeota archaeon]MBD3282769.1 ATP-dependent DNA ligase [Candidatus Pacearchaeota archaeon]
MQYSQLCKVYEELEQNSSRLKKTEILADFLKKLKKEKDQEIIYLLQGKTFPDYSEKEFGISEKLCIKALTKASGTSDKEIIERWRKIGDIGKVAEQIMGRKKQNTLFSHKLTAKKVLDNLKKLPELEGKGTIERKLALISELLTSASGTEAKYIIRTLLGDLRVGTGEGTIRDSIRDACFETSSEEDTSKKSLNVMDSENKKQITETIQDAYDKSTDWKLVFEQACKGLSALKSTELTPGKPVKVMLFPKEDSFEDGFSRVGKPALIDYKYDGFRMMINKNNNQIKVFTRRLDDVSKQFPEVKEYVKKYIKGESFILDTEAVGYDPETKKYRPFQEISQRIKRKYDIDKMARELPIEINVFDIIYYNNKSLIKTPFKERRKIIEKIIEKHPYKIRPSEAIITESVEKAENFYKKAIEDGEEGVMMKNLEAPYKPGSRVGYGIKIKPSENDFDLVIIEAEYGTGKRAGWLSSYTVACRKDNKFLEIGKVSTGLKEKTEGLTFKELTKKLKPLITKEHGRTVEVKPKLVVTVVYQNIQKSPKYSSGFALRFPRITRLRPDRKAGDVATLEEVKKEVERKS